MNTMRYRTHTIFLLSSVVEEMSCSCPVKRGEEQNPEGKQGGTWFRNDEWGE